MSFVVNYSKYYGFVLFFTTFLSYGQTIDIGAIGKGKPFKISGGLSLNSVFTRPNNNSLPAFTYFMQGNLSVSFYQFSVPISYSFTNQGSQLNYQLPFNFNRISLHPKYEWIQTHIGITSMTFSPYTLAGHQFTGGGIELSPKGKFKISAMYGTLLKATVDTSATMGTYERVGYGTKLEFDNNNYKLFLIAFYARDNENSIELETENTITPKDNVVLSIGGKFKILDNLAISIEQASSVVTNDIRAPVRRKSGEGLVGLLIRDKPTTEYYHAFKSSLNYTLGKSAIGIGYERIDPNYHTFGAYFFNNDFENLTLNTSTSLLKGKMNLSANLGLQRDDLENQKENTTVRTVGSINSSIQLTDKVSLTGSYSNFRTLTNNKISLYDTIPDDIFNGDLDLLNYSQLSQSANVAINLALSNNEQSQQNLSINYTLSDVANAQNGIVRIGNASIFHNGNIGYTLGLPNKGASLNSSVNFVYNTIGRGDSKALGALISLTKSFFNKKLNSTFGTSFNSVLDQNTKTFNIRANLSYVLKEKHNFNLNAIELINNIKGRKKESTTITIGYSYNF